MLRKLQSSPALRVTLAAMLFSLVAIGTLLFAVYSMYWDALDVAAGHAEDMATLLSDDVAHGATAIDMALRAASDIVATTTKGTAIEADRAEELHKLLLSHRQMLGANEIVAIADDKGDVISGSDDWEPAPINVVDREYFAAFRDGLANGLFISKPQYSRLDGALKIFFARKIARPDGHFLGVAFVGVKPAELFKHHPALTAIGEKTFSLFYADSTVAWREPETPGVVGRPAPDAEQWLKVAAAGGGLFHSHAAFDSYDKFVAVRQVSDLPLFVNVAVTDRAALKNWVPRAIALLGSALVCLALIGALLFSQTRLIARLSRSRLRSWMRAKRLSVKQRELAAMQARFGLTLDVMSQGMAMFDRERRLVVANRCYAELYGLDSGVIKPGMHAREIFALRIAAGAYCGETPEDYYARLDARSVSERTDKLRNGRYIHVRNSEAGDGAWATIQEDVTESFRAAEELAYAARHDALTGLANRAVFKSHLVEHLESAGRQPFAAMVIDINGFKEVNDTYGHEVGDGVLSEVARRFEQAPGVALLARLGGDEFALVTKPCASANEAEGMAGQLLETGRRSILLDGRFISLDLSLGVYVVGPDERDASQIMRRLDLALSAAKARGHNGYQMFEDELERRYLDRYQIARDLRGAIAADQLEVHYQPIFDRRGKRIICMEALARWRHPQRGLVPPGTFIPIAEAAGLIGEIGEWVLRRAAADAASWPSDITVAVNVSALQAERPDFVDDVLAALKETGLPAHRLQLEITESILLRADATIEAMLARLRAEGVTFALDDFGTGYASLAYLKMFPIDKIKVDQSFVKDVCKDAHSIAIVSAIVALARGFDAPTTAEGVETAEQFETLRALGVDAMQGYYFGRPKPIAEFSPGAIVGADKSSAA